MTRDARRRGRQILRTCGNGRHGRTLHHFVRRRSAAAVLDSRCATPREAIRLPCWTCAQHGSSCLHQSLSDRLARKKRVNTASADGGSSSLLIMLSCQIRGGRRTDALAPCPHSLQGLRVSRCGRASSAAPCSPPPSPIQMPACFSLLAALSGRLRQLIDPNSNSIYFTPL